MHVKIQGGTAAEDQEGLCATCQHAAIVRGARLRDEIVRCSAHYPATQITFRVTFCTDYSDSRRASLDDMKEVAWILRSDPRKTEIGFVRANSVRDEDEDKDVPEE